MSDEENIDQAGDTGVDLTADERNLVQQARNSGGAAKVLEKMKPAESAGTNSGSNAGTGPASVTPEMVARQATAAAEIAMAQRDLKGVLSATIAEFPTLKDDPIELEQIELQAAKSVRARADYKDLKSADQMAAAFKEEVTKECKRKSERHNTASAGEQKSEAEERLARQKTAVEGGGKSSGHSARPTTGAVGLESIDESVFGTDAQWPSDEMSFVNKCRADDQAFIDKRMGRSKK